MNAAQLLSSRSSPVAQVNKPIMLGMHRVVWSPAQSRAESAVGMGRSVNVPGVGSHLQTASRAGWDLGKIHGKPTPGAAGCEAAACKCGGVWVTAQRLGRAVFLLMFGTERGYCWAKS
jgi:hypothetical protein